MIAVMLLILLGIPAHRTPTIIAQYRAGPKIRLWSLFSGTRGGPTAQDSTIRKIFSGERAVAGSTRWFLHFWNKRTILTAAIKGCASDTGRGLRQFQETGKPKLVA